ncbi:MAG: hypothetical protein R2851_15530 [Caldilineaceae bacterium]
MVEIGLPACDVMTATRYELRGALDSDDLHRLAEKLLCNATIQHFTIGPIFPSRRHSRGQRRMEAVPLRTASDAELRNINRTRLPSPWTWTRCAPSSASTGTPASTDVELETLAFERGPSIACARPSAHIDFHPRGCGRRGHRPAPGGRAAQTVHPRGHGPGLSQWLHSAFVDDAGIIAFDDTTIWPSRSRPTTIRRRWNPLARPTPVWAA